MIGLAQEYWSKQLPFVLYRKPGCDKLCGLFQDSNEVYISKSLKETGFVFAPFNDQNISVIFPDSRCKSKLEILDFSELQQKKITQFNSELEDQIFFENLVSKSIKEIDRGRFTKVVVSRKFSVRLDSLSLFETFKQALASYHNAFVYLWFHPNIGTWLGATPERLVQVEGDRFQTVALAGTISEEDFETKKWTGKEITEHRIVADYIMEQLSPISEKIELGNTETIKAGSLFHLRSTIGGKLASNNELIDLVGKLHPTPAVGGFPKNNAIPFILDNEGYNRKYYTGYLGPINYHINDNEQSDLYVNLRCMEISDKTITLYAGCGITEDSDPHKEWLETVNKMKTMGSILC